MHADRGAQLNATPRRAATAVPHACGGCAPPCPAAGATAVPHACGGCAPPYPAAGAAAGPCTPPPGFHPGPPISCHRSPIARGACHGAARVGDWHTHACFGAHQLSRLAMA
jgi:hypothetical protein